MKRKMPQVREYMTKSPWVAQASDSLESAHRKMEEIHIRHLPVKKEGKLVGVLSEQNSLAARMHTTSNYTVADAMVPDPYVVEPDTPLDEAAANMAEEKYGCAIVQENNQVVGIFTTVDACRALREVLETAFPD